MKHAEKLASDLIISLFQARELRAARTYLPVYVCRPPYSFAIRGARCSGMLPVWPSYGVHVSAYSSQLSNVPPFTTSDPQERRHKECTRLRSENLACLGRNDAELPRKAEDLMVCCSGPPVLRHRVCDGACNGGEGFSCCLSRFPTAYGCPSLVSVTQAKEQLFFATCQVKLN